MSERPSPPAQLRGEGSTDSSQPYAVSASSLPLSAELERGSGGEGGASLTLAGAVAVAAAGVLPVMVLVYAGVRVLQARLYPEPDPATVIWSTRIGLFWRLGLCGYVGLMLLPLGARWARRDPVGAARAVGWLVPAAAVALALQAGWVP